MINMVPDSAEADIALCLAPSVTASKAMERVKELLSRSVGIEVDTILESDPNFTPPHQHLINTLRGAYQSVIGRDAKPFLSTGTSDAHGFRLRGIPTALFGPGDMSVIHAYDEYANVKDLTAFAKIYFRTAVEFCL
jgi:succinyl-diaminopimelate desuccinylase